MSPQIALQNLLNAKFAEIRAHNPGFSLQAFSQHLAMNRSTLIDLLAGDLHLSRTMAEDICEKIPLDPQDRAELLRGFPHPGPSNREPAAPVILRQRYERLSMGQHRSIWEWHHYAILSLLKTKDFQSDATWIADRLGLSANEITTALTQLESLGVIAQDTNGNWKRTARPLRTTDDVPNQSLALAHQQNLKLAAKKLETTSIELRDFSSITFAIDPRHLPKAKTLIRQFQDDLSELLTAEPGTEVYRFCTQLFPLSNVRPPQENDKCELS